MASVQQSVNSFFNTALASAMTGSRVFQQSAMGQRIIGARRQEAELKNINKNIRAFGQEVDTMVEEGKEVPQGLLKQVENLGEQGKKGVLNLASLTGDPKDVKRAAAGLQTADDIKKRADEIYTQQREAREAEVKQQNQQSAEDEFYHERAMSQIAQMSPAELAAAQAATALNEEAMSRFMTRGG